MLLERGGIDVWYVDESSDSKYFAVSAIAVPLLRQQSDGWKLEWDDHFAAVRAFRRTLRQTHGVPATKELHAVKLASGRGRYNAGKASFGKEAGARVYKHVLSQLSFLQDASIISVVGHPGSSLYKQTKLVAAMHALFQRMQRACVHTKRKAMVFFDEGHGEYRTIYRRARVYLPTGSSLGGWNSGSSRNLPMANFFKDANIKNSEHSQFIQLADMIAYAALQNVRARYQALSPWHLAAGLDKAYELIPRRVVNLAACGKDPINGIVTLL